MPLIKSASREAVSANIRRERAAGKPQRQAVAIALETARRAKRHKADGGVVGAPDVRDVDVARQAELDLKRRMPRGDVLRTLGGLDRLGRQRAAAEGYAAGGAPSAGAPPWYVRNEARALSHTGPLISPIGGRTDHIPLNVPGGAYVLPADVVSGLGQGNTLNGTRVLQHMFSSGPYGAAVPKMGAGRGAPKLPKSKFADGGDVAPTSEDAITAQMARVAAANRTRSAVQPLGGRGALGAPPVPIMAAGGEFVVHPEQVTSIGGGDIDRGHEILDAFVKRVRGATIKTMSKLPGPERD